MNKNDMNPQGIFEGKLLLSSRWISGLAIIGLSCLPGCEDPYAGDPKPAEVVKPEKKRATTAYGKAMEAATDLRDKQVPEYNKKLEDLADPFAK